MSGLGMTLANPALFRPRRSSAPQTGALVARMSLAPTAARVQAIDTLVRALLAAGIWAKLDALYLMAAHDEQAARLNWVSAAYTMTAVNSPTFTVDRGFNGNGTTSYLDTTFNPVAAAGAKFVRDSAFLGIWSLTESAINSNDIGTFNGATGATIHARLTSNLFNGFANGGALVADASPTSRGFFAWSRPNASTADKYINGVRTRTLATTSTALNNLPFYVGGINQSGTISGLNPRQYACVVIGGALSLEEVAALYAALRSYLSHPTIGAV